jgi:hypothetical protein
LVSGGSNAVDQVKANLPDNMSMKDYNNSINGWIKQPDGSWKDENGDTQTDTNGDPLP